MGNGSNVPTRKVGLGLVAGLPVGVVVVWLLKTYVISASTPMPEEVAVAIGSICSFIISYIIPEPAESA
jgi:hypothetical protein